MPLEIEITPPPQKISEKKQAHTGQKLLHFQCYIQETSALTTFVASTKNDVSRAKRQSRDTTRMLSTEEGEGVDFRIRTSSDHSFF